MSAAVDLLADHSSGAYVNFLRDGEERPAGQIGAAWVCGVGTVVGFAMILGLADLPAEVARSSPLRP